MKKTICLLSLLSILISCASPMKPVEKSSVFDTEIGFTLLPPPNGPWYRMQTPDNTGYVLGREKSEQDKKDGSTVIAEVRYGHINLKNLGLKNSKDTLNFFEQSMKDISNTDRFDEMKNTFSPVRFKKADCMNFNQSGIDKTAKSLQGEKMKMSYKGILCLHPKDQTRYIRMSVSQRVPVGRKFMDLSADKKAFYNSLRFTEPTGTPPQ